MPIGDQNVGVPEYQNGRAYLTGFSSDDFQNVEMMFSFSYTPMSDVIPDDLVQAMLDYIAASPSVAAVALDRAVQSYAQMTPTAG